MQSGRYPVDDKRLQPVGLHPSLTPFLASVRVSKWSVFERQRKPGATVN